MMRVIRELSGMREEDLGVTVVGLCIEVMDYVGCSKVEYSKSTKSKHRNILLSMANYARVFL